MFGIEFERVGYAVKQSDGPVSEYAMRGVMRTIGSLFASGERQLISGSGQYVVCVERTGQRGHIADLEGYAFRAEIFEPDGVRNVDLIAIPREESDFFKVSVIEI